jgi:hypothetical protein
MKRFLVLLVAAPLGLAACESPEVVVEASLAREEAGETVALAELPVQFLPYDRDAIFDSLEAAAGTPEPAIPPEILQQQEAVQAAQAEWRTAEERWAEVRDSLRTLSQRTEQMRAQGLRGTPQYRQAFEQFTRLENEVTGLEEQKDEAFDRFTALQQATFARVDSIRVVREAWAENAFADFGQIIEARIEESGREVVVDTTNAQGIARANVPAGRWWIYSRYALPYEELYWNIPIEVTGEGTAVTLTRENAEVRPAL